MNPNLRKAALVVVAVIVVCLAWAKPLDRIAQEHVDDGLKRAVVTYASARALNAVLSIAKETAVSLEPLGVGVAAKPGQLLEPLDELVRQFSVLMLAACASLAIQKLLISIGGLEWISALVTVALAAWVWWRWNEREPRRWLVQFVAIVLFIRFAVPVAALGTELVFRVGLSDAYANAHAQVEAPIAELAATEANQKERGLFDRFKDWVGQKKQDVGAYVERVKGSVDRAVSHFITLTGIFVLQTMILPLAFLWLVRWFLRQTLSVASSGYVPELRRGIPA